MNKHNRDGTRMLTLVLIFTLMFTISLSILPEIKAQSILTTNSAVNLNSITYSLNASDLGLTNIYTISIDNSTNTTSVYNNTYSTLYSCQLTANNTVYTSNGAMADVHSVINITQSLSVPLVDGYYNSSLNCTYDITNASTTTTTTTYFNTSSNQTYNLTTINTTSSYYLTSLSNNAVILVDTTPPVINITYPNNSAIYTPNNNAIIQFNYSVSSLSQTICRMIITTGDNTVNTSNSTISSPAPNILSINMSIGNYSYNLTCTDALGNSNAVNSQLQVLSNSTGSNDVFFNIQLSKSAFGLGEIGYYTINANNNANVTITICPVASGWVQCYMTPTFINYAFPVTQALPYTNKTGAYLIQGVMYYKNYTLTSNITYSVVNTVTASITPSNTIAGVGDIVAFNASASGGIGSYTYSWVMDDGTKFSGPGAFKNYTVAGSFPINLTVNDSQGNQYTISTSVNIKNYYALSVIAIDDVTGLRVSDATATVDDNDEQTDSNGLAYFRLLDGTYDVYVSKNNIGGYINNIVLNKDQTVYMNMSFVDNVPPQITLLTDTDNLFSVGGVALRFKAEDQSNMTCSIYTAGINDSWYTQQDSGDNLLPDTEYTFNLNNLPLGAYKWKIECLDSENNKVDSEERTFIVSDSAIASALQSTSNNSDAINNALDNMNALSGDESDVADILGVKTDLKDLLDRINRMDRDIHDLSYRRDLNDTGKADAQKNITDTIEYLKYNTPINIKVDNSKTFVKYIKDPDMKTLIDDYIAANQMNVNKEAFLTSTKLVQSKAIVSTKVRNVILYYLDGKTKEITLVTKDIQISKPEDGPLFDNSKTITFVESVPKSIIQSAGLMHILNQDYTVIKDDPLIEFPSTTRAINYYIDSNVDPSVFEQADTVIIDRNIQSIKSTTGLSILGLDSIGNIQIDGQAIMIIIIVVLLLFYLVMHFDLISKLRNLGFGSKKKVSYIKVLINDALDYLEAEDYDKAAFTYREIKLSYEDSNTYVRSQTYEESYDLCNRLDLSYASYLLEKIDSCIKQENKNAAILEFEKLENTYNKMDDSYKQEISQKFQNILSRIKMLL